QMSAERERRAMITQANGKKEAAIRVAEGEKQATILKAEGEKRATILKAEGEKQAAILRAEGLATALEKINSVALKLDSRTLALQYLDMFRALAASPSTKLLIPMEFTSLVEPFRKYITTTVRTEKEEKSE
ncbi:MAG: SPFH/Band 7/PHB domain protein, partial [Thermoprotei archaeon]|nr:SPFH/Band 7/PHB domain protein [Thermoprotei archaeon]